MYTPGLRLEYQMSELKDTVIRVCDLPSCNNTLRESPSGGFIGIRVHLEIL